jgi:hypothetical protein
MIDPRVQAALGDFSFSGEAGVEKPDADRLAAFRAAAAVVLADVARDRREAFEQILPGFEGRA